MNESLTSHEVEQLISLRIALTEAVSNAKRAGRYQRGAVIVALDATVERASSIVATTRGITIPKNGALDDLISKLKQDFGSEWVPRVLPDIRHLRRARNAAQHEGLEPDREQLPRWASATETYVHSLIAAQYKVDVRRIVLADAVQDIELRGMIGRAEVAREQNDYRASVDECSSAYEEARSRWNGFQRNHRVKRSPFNTQIFDRKSFEYLDSRVTIIEQVEAASSFSSSPAEAEWFVRTIAEQGDVFDAEDADRALSFAFQWVVEFERAAEAWTPDRYHRAALAQRKVREAPVPAHIGGCSSVDVQDDTVVAELLLANVPPEDQYEQWRARLHELLTSETTWWMISDAGMVTLTKTLNGTTDLSPEITALKTALQQVHSEIPEALKEVTHAAEKAEARSVAFTAVVDSIRHQLPAWVSNIEWASSEEGPPDSIRDQMILTTIHEVDDLRFDAGTAGTMFEGRLSLRDIIRQHENVDQCYHPMTLDGLGVEPVLQAADLLQMLADVDHLVVRQLEASKHERAQHEATVTGARKSILDAIAEQCSGLETEHVPRGLEDISDSYS